MKGETYTVRASLATFCMNCIPYVTGNALETAKQKSGKVHFTYSLSLSSGMPLRATAKFELRPADGGKKFLRSIGNDLSHHTISWKKASHLVPFPVLLLLDTKLLC
jgi:hypothetical protein